MCPPMADKFYLLDCFVTLAMTLFFAFVSSADLRPCRILRFAWIHCEPRMWRGNPVYFMRVSAPNIPKLRPMGRSFVSRILWFFFIGYRRGTRHPSQQPIGHQLCIVCHQILCSLDSFLPRDWLPNHPLSPVQPPQ